MMDKPVIISACMMGIDCRYDGRSKIAVPLLTYCQRHKIMVLPVCPEQLGGLPTPRSPACFRDGDGKSVINGSATLYNREGRDVSRSFLAGARQALKIARLSGSQHAVFQERSPSCGVHNIYLGEDLVPGSGVTTALFRMKGIMVWTIEEFSDFCQTSLGEEWSQ